MSGRGGWRCEEAGEEDGHGDEVDGDTKKDSEESNNTKLILIIFY